MRKNFRNFFLGLFVVTAMVIFASFGLCSDFIRGDVDQSRSLNLSDSINVILYLFAGSGNASSCLSAADMNDSGAVDLADAIYGLNYLFAGGPPPPPPFPECGPDPTADDLTCAKFSPCESREPGQFLYGKERNPNPAVDPSDLQKLVEGMSEFAWDFYKNVSSKEGNMFFSPYSISVAFAMLYAGAKGGTEAEMAQALHFSLPQERLHPAFNALDIALQSRGEGAEGRDGEGFRLNVANALWCQYDYNFLDSYLGTIGENYGAGIGLLDFRREPEPSRRIINDWVSKKTEGKIEDLLPQGSITDLTRLVITNAIYFNAAWKTPFQPEATFEGSFYLVDGTEVKVPLMRGRLGCRLASGSDFVAVELPYDGDELSMVIIAPEKGKFKDFEGSANYEKVKSIINELSPADIQLTMPKFNFKSKFSLNKTLMDLGMRSAFSPTSADFSGIDGTRNLFVHAALHQAYVSVDEAGTEAAAATGIVVGITSVPPEVTIDRPFIFLIRDKPTGTILFLGRLLDPR